MSEHAEPAEPVPQPLSLPAAEPVRGIDRDSERRQGSSPPTVVAAFSAFYREFVPTLVAFLVWQGARLADAADLAQDTMVQAYRYWETIERPEAWTRRVASRAYARRIANIDDDPTVEIPEPSVLLRPTTDVVAFEQRHEILRLLAVLPSRQRQVMAWTYDGYTPSEIAEELKISPEAVRSNLLKARRTLAAHLNVDHGGTQ